MSTILVTGVTGYIGGEVVPALLSAGHQVRVLTRDHRRLDGKEWAANVEVIEGDAADPQDCRRALAGIDVAYYLLHSMDGAADFVGRDREMAETFAAAAVDSGVARIVYLGGLHPDGVLSEHLRSRVEVGEVFLSSSVPTAVLQAGVVLGDGSASFNMLRHLTERLPVMVAPRWVSNRIQPIAVADVVHYLVGAAALDADVDRSFDIGGPDVMTYAEMIHRYAASVGLGRRAILSVPVLTPRLAGLWIGLVTPVSPGVARPLLGSLGHEAICRDDDILTVVGAPPGGRTGFDDAIAAATRSFDPQRWRRTLRRVSATVAAAASIGSLLTDADSRWYRRLRTPRWQPPRAVFPVVWTALYASTALATAAASAELAESSPAGVRRAARLERALVANMTLNAAWSGLFFRVRRLGLAAAEAAALTVSSADLARRAGAAPGRKGLVVALYAAWCGFATALTAASARANRR